MDDVRDQYLRGIRSGWLLTCIIERWQPRQLMRPLTCVGFLGAWTTMSALATEADVLAKDGHVALAATYVLATLLAGTAATAAGILLARVQRGFHD